MWKKLVSLNLALLMLISMLPMNVAADYVIDLYVHKNRYENDTKYSGESYYLLTSNHSLRLLYSAIYSDFGDSDRHQVNTSYNSKPDGTGTPYFLTTSIQQIQSSFSAQASKPDHIYAQWETIPDSGHYILYIGAYGNEALGPSKDGKDYILESGLSGKVTLQGADAFETGDRKIIEWVSIDAGHIYGQSYPLGSEIEITSNLVLLPVLETNTSTSGIYAITFQSVGGGGVRYTNTDGKLNSLPPDPIWDGHTFEGWYTSETGGDKISIDTVYTGNTTVYAHWTLHDTPQKIYTITYDGNTWKTDSTGKVTDLPKDPTKDGYIFDGWYTGETGGNKVIIGTTLDGNITIYPHWKPDSGNPSDKVYIIIIDGGGQVTTGSDGKLTTLPATPTRPGYIFDGWYTHPDGGDRVTTDYIFTGPITIYPHWREDSTPDVTYYPIYTPDRTPGGSYSVSRRYATPGTRITIELSPRSSYDLDWLSVTNLTTGWDVPITERYWDEYTFIMPSSAVEVDISYVYRYNYNYHYSSNVYFTYAEPQPAAAGPNAWYYRDRHIYHVTDGLVPDITPITRDMLISVLYNLTDHSVTDSTAVGSETNDSQVWATEHNIVPDIYVSGLWGQDKTITREQAAMLIFRYAGYRGRSTSQSVGLTRYRDYSRLNPIARTAMSWTLATGLMSSTSAATLSPQDNLTCGQAGDLIYRFVTTIA